MKKNLICTLFMIQTLGNIVAQKSGLFEVLDTVITAYEQVYGYSGTVKIVSGDREIFQRSYGLASRPFNIKNTSQTRFSINSISKVFTATAILIMVQNNQLELSETIDHYLPDIDAKWRDSITIHHLLTHTSGLPRELGIEPYESLTFKQQLSHIEEQLLLFSPGQRYGYSNIGFVILGAIIERVSSPGRNHLLISACPFQSKQQHIDQD